MPLRVYLLDATSSLPSPIVMTASEGWRIPTREATRSSGMWSPPPSLVCMSPLSLYPTVPARQRQSATPSILMTSILVPWVWCHHNAQVSPPCVVHSRKFTDETPVQAHQHWRHSRSVVLVNWRVGGSSDPVSLLHERQSSPEHGEGYMRKLWI